MKRFKDVKEKKKLSGIFVNQNQQSQKLLLNVMSYNIKTNLLS